MPPGFAVMTENLDSLKSKRTIDRYEVTPRQLILYVRDIRPGAPVKLKYRLRALYPVRVTVPSSAVYDYYNPEAVRSVSGPMEIVVN